MNVTTPPVSSYPVMGLVLLGIVLLFLVLAAFAGRAWGWSADTAAPTGNQTALPMPSSDPTAGEIEPRDI